MNVHRQKFKIRSGINDEAKHCPLINWIRSSLISFGAILETHVQEPNLNHILYKLGPEWSIISNYLYSPLGKIWVIFKLPTKVKLLTVSLQSITVEVLLEDGHSFIYTAVYACNSLEIRRELWDSLRVLFSSLLLSSRPWLVNGAFNEILYPSKTSNSAIFRSSSAMRAFGECLADVGLFDLLFQGPRFTWSNHQPKDPICKRIDRCLVNGPWLMEFPLSRCEFEAPLFSDHCPCRIQILPKPRSFVSNLGDLCFKLKQLKLPLKSLCKENYSDLEKRVLAANDILLSAQVLALNDPSEANLRAKKEARVSWVSLQQAEESILGNIRGQFCPELPDFLESFNLPSISASQQESLLAPVTKEVIQDSLRRIPSSKTLGPDGLTAEFLRAAWSIIGEELSASVINFFSSSFMPSALNSTSLVLLPKRPGAEELKDFRPISCLNTVYKLITRILADWLKDIMPSLVDLNQTAFFKDMLLLENVLLASEVLNGYHRDSSPGKFTLKVDISKAFDSIHWDFILSSLQA
ncbi:uncharacterized protein LOC112085189 [Eutrema salsugineum]|uniref:uncharacterized protein LOC112085189 n=1 Tax=Eutrema salsugineum TaxID=72664 RepID=UPI000CECFA26|nr:uncharacterized protein LOC112085189 [Eutrema salsugineum]